MRAGCAVSLFVALLSSCAGTGANAPAVETARLQRDVAWLADDAREGRRAGTPGELAAAEYIAERMEALGLEPAGSDGYFQEFPVPLTPLDGGESSVSWSSGDAGVGRSTDPSELRPLFCSSGGTASGGLVFCGYGIADDELGRDDFGADGAGRVALIVRGVPPYPPTEQTGPGAKPPTGDEPPEGWGGAGSLFLKVMNAKRRGFEGVLIVPHPKAEEDIAPFDASRAARAGIPAAMVSVELAERFFPGSYAEFVRNLDERKMVTGAVAHAGVELTLTTDVRRGEGVARNVLGRIPGERVDRTVVLGAHFDHLGRGGPGSLAPNATGEIHNGADDNASGTACVLELARILTEGPPPDGDVLIALWSGEELGLLGSEHWADHPTVPLEHIRANVNLDMVGRAGDGVLQILGAGSAAQFAEWMEPAGAAADLELSVNLSGRGLGGSDHQVFLNRNISALHLFSGVHTDYHKPSDDTERFEVDGARRVVALGLDLVARIQAEKTFAYVEPEVDLSMQPASPRDRGWSVWFGTVPAYDYDGEGLLLTGTSPGSPAEAAGLLKDDLILQVGDVEIETIHDFVYVLKVHKPGDVVSTRFRRAGVEQEVLITLGTREAL